MGDGALLGTQVGNYRITSLLGRGGMGEVYLAEHPRIGRRVAVKVLSRDLLTTSQLVDRFVAEARAVARIGHPNVVEVYDFGNLEDGRLYYTMEVLSGHELRHEMDQRGKLRAHDVLPYLEQICAGLQAAHVHGVVHRDLKPENVFVLDKQPLTLKLLDFGIAKLLETKQGSGLTSSGIVMGTPLFMAPEQALGQTERISARTDLYSLGVMLYWMLAGRPPFAGEAYAVVLAKHIQEAPPPLASVAPAVPLDVAAVVERCLEKDPLQRYASANELLEAFAAAVKLASPDLERALAGTLSTGHRSESATGLPLRFSTTISGSASELQEPIGPEDELPRSSAGKWIAIAAGAATVTVVAALLLVRGNDGQVVAPRQPLPTVTAAAPRAATPDASAPTPPQRQAIVIRVEDTSAICRLRVNAGAPRTTSPPCRFELPLGAQVHLEVEQNGRRSFSEEWIVTGDRTIELDRDAPVRAARPSAGRRARVTLPAGSSAPPHPPPAAPAVAKPQPATLAPPSATPKKATPAPERKKKPEHVGEGTLEMD